MIQAATAIVLSCVGMSDTPASSTVATNVYRDGQSASANSTIYGRERLTDRMTVEIANGIVRTKGPDSLEPAIAGRGDDGWRTLTNVTMTDEEIRGKLSYSWVMKPTVRIDRMSGEIDITNRSLVAGMWSFKGQCERQERASPLF